MSFLQKHYAQKLRLDEKTAWIGQAFAGLRSRQLSYGGGDFLSMVDVLIERLRASQDSELNELADWVEHCEKQQRGMFARINDFTTLLAQTTAPAEVDANELNALIEQCLAQTPEAERIRSARLRPCRIQIDRQHFKNIITELLFNAVKFSPANSTVDLFTAQADQHLVLSIMNCCAEKSEVFAALKVRGRNALGEPFIGGFDHPRIHLPGYDLCIGLCFASSLAHRLGGELVLSDAFDFSQERPRPRFRAALHLPLIPEEPADPQKFQLKRLARISRNQD